MTTLLLPVLFLIEKNGRCKIKYVSKKFFFDANKCIYIWSNQITFMNAVLGHTTGVLYSTTCGMLFLWCSCCNARGALSEKMLMKVLSHRGCGNS